jgi:GTP-binding protein HflX
MGGAISPIDTDDIVDLALLRLDSLSVLKGMDSSLATLHTVHLMPPGPDYGENLVPHTVLEHTDPYRSPFNYREFIEELENEISTKTKSLYEADKNHAAILVGVFTKRQGAGEHMAELQELTQSAGLDILGLVTQFRDSVHPRTVVGPGKLQEIVISALVKGADTIIFDNNLTPAQAKAIVESTEINVMDRTQLILEIFAQRAKSSEGKIRVELARLKYFLPYLTGRDDALSRITGGIDGKGPGETKLEIDRRRVSERITMLSDKLKKIERTRVTQRTKRRRNELPIVSIIGYTNAGKSTLLNTLTKSDVYADNRMFATLDTSSKRIRFPQDRDVIITDTVGFIRDLPADLAGAFKSTLEELDDADLLIHLVDASSSYSAQQINSVEKILKEIDLTDKSRLIVYNKVDLISDEMLSFLRAEQPQAVFVSALDRSSLNVMLETLYYILFESGKLRGLGYE